MPLRNPRLLIPIWNDFVGKKYELQSNSVHLAKAINWLVESQNANQDGGSASQYAVKAWLDSYPETTGYIIPTFLKYSIYSGESEYVDKAIRMSDYLLDLQMTSGAFPGGKISVNGGAATIFNTGQILFGLCSIYKQTKEEKYLTSAVKAGDWMCEMQDEDGCWRKALSTAVDDIPHVYNVRAAWALLKLNEIQPNDRYVECNKKNVNWCLEQKNENHWFDKNAFYENSDPFTHNICYTLRGILESGIQLKNDDYIEEVKKSVDEMIKRINSDGSFAARFRSDWTSKDKFSCLTGDLQMAIILAKLYQLFENPEYKELMKKINLHNKTLQRTKGHPSICGAIKGAHPFWGKYCPYSFPNWATKFFVDALLMEEELKTAK